MVRSFLLNKKHTRSFYPTTLFYLNKTCMSWTLVDLRTSFLIKISRNFISFFFLETSSVVEGVTEISNRSEWLFLGLTPQWSLQPESYNQFRLYLLLCSVVAVTTAAAAPDEKILDIWCTTYIRVPCLQADQGTATSNERLRTLAA